jgi:DivIVA domain-containing protein
MNPDEIARTDFPSSRKGYDRDAVDAHLKRLAEMISDLERGASAGASSVAGGAGAKVTEILSLAEAKAAEIEAEARQRAEAIVDDARERVNRLGRELSGSAEEAPQAEVNPEPAVVPEPTIPQPEVDPTPTIVPEPAPEPMPEPTPDPAPEPGTEPMPEPTPLPPQPDVPPAANGGVAAAKLVALKMALDGSSREEIERELASEYGLEDSGPLLDDVLARAGR